MLSDLTPPQAEAVEVDEIQETQSDYTFQTGRVSDYEDALMNDLQTDKQVYNERRAEDYLEVEETPKTSVASKIERETRQSTADFIVNMGDMAIDFVAHFFYSDEEFEETGKEEKAEMAKHLAPCLPENKPMSPWVMFFITVVFVYGRKFQSAAKLKKANRILEEQQITILQMQQEREEDRKKIQQLENLKK